MAEIEIRSEPKNTLWLRYEQLNKWSVSETNQASCEPKVGSAVQFEPGIVFLAACNSGDLEEVARLLRKGCNINTANEDGLTALHNASINGSQEVVEFLVEQGANLNACDKEGWTPLHAAASCGKYDIVKYLVQKGANVAVVNCDCELPSDVAESDKIEEFLEEEMERKGIDPEDVQRAEERQMLNDATNWLNSEYTEVADPVTGATALHVAAAKGYQKVIETLLKAGADVNAQDNDGWTPLHAAAHWAQEEACRLLVLSKADIEAQTNDGRTLKDVADEELLPTLEDLEKQAKLLRSADQLELIMKQNQNKRRPSSSGRSVTRLSLDQKQALSHRAVEDERVVLEEMKNTPLDEGRSDSNSSVTLDPIPQKVPLATHEDESTDESSSDEDSSEDSEMVEVQPQKTPDREYITNGTAAGDSGSNSSSAGNVPEALSQQKPSPNRGPDLISSPTASDPPKSSATSPKAVPTPASPTATTSSPTTTNPKVLETQRSLKEEDPSSWRAGLRKIGSSGSVAERLRDAELGTPRLEVTRSASSSVVEKKEDQFRTQRFNSNQEDKSNSDFYARYKQLLSPTTEPGTPPTGTSSPTNAGRVVSSTSASYTPYVPLHHRLAASTTGPTSTATTTTAAATEPANGNRSVLADVKRTTDDEVREVERKAKARRVRESRQSTQGVNREDVMRAEAALKEAANTPASVPVNQDAAAAEERKRRMELEKKLSEERIQRLAAARRNATSQDEKSSRVTPTTGAGDASSVPYQSQFTGRGYRSAYLLQKEDEAKSANKQTKKEEEKEDPSKKSTAIRSRRKRESRRPTGTVTLEDLKGMCEIQEDGEVSVPNSTAPTLDSQSSRYGSSSRYSEPASSNPPSSTLQTDTSRFNRDRPVSYAGVPSWSYGPADTSNTSIDYRKLYEQEKIENEKLRKDVDKFRRELSECREELEKSRLQTDHKTNDSKDKRALERRVSELEEEMRNRQESTNTIEAENRRLREENSALIRVISKLSK